jgi:hypothetical protein
MSKNAAMKAIVSAIVRDLDDSHPEKAVLVLPF